MTRQIGLARLAAAGGRSEVEIASYSATTPSRGCPPKAQIECWRKYTYQAGISDGQTERAKQDAFKRAKDGLLAKQLICLWGGMCGQWRNRSHGAVAAGGEQWPLATGVTSGNVWR